jgi:hypothetical protein
MAFDGIEDQIVRLAEGDLVAGQPRQQAIGATPIPFVGIDRMQGRQQSRVILQLLVVEQLGPQRRLVGRTGYKPAVIHALSQTKAFGHFDD